MALEIGIGISIQKNNILALKTSIERAMEQVPNPKGALMFTSINFTKEQIRDTLTNILPNIPFAGCSSFSEISNIAVSQKSVLTVLFGDDSFEFVSTHVPYSENGHNTGVIAGKEHAKKLVNFSPDCLYTTIALCGDGKLEGIDYLNGITDGLEKAIALSGGNAALFSDILEEIELQSGYIFNMNECFTDGIGLFTIVEKEPNSCKICYSFESSWTPVA